MKLDLWNNLWTNRTCTDKKTADELEAGILDCWSAGYYRHGLEPQAVLMGEVGVRGFEGVESSATEAPYIRFIQNQETLKKLSAIV